MNQKKINNLLRCPKCQAVLNSSEKSNLCDYCGITYSFNHNDQARFIEKELYDDFEDYEHILSVDKYWDAGWRARNQEHSFIYNLSSQELSEYAKKQKKRGRVGLLQDVDFDKLDKKIGVNIGSGAGFEASYLMTLGNCSLISIDVSSEAAKKTQEIIDKLGLGKALQADARYLPIASNSIDFVYSGGVLHHSRNIHKSINEIYRILKPGGIAYVGLYSKTSLYFQYLNFKAVLSGSFTKEQIHNKLSSNTETSWRSKGSRNPHTRIYGTLECKKLFHKFNFLHIRKGNFILPDRAAFKPLKFLEKSRTLEFFGGGIYIKARK